MGGGAVSSATVGRQRLRGRMAGEIRSILVVLDPSAALQPALDKAAAIAAASGARLRLFCCDHDPRLTARLMLSPDALSAARAGYLRRRREWLQSLAATLEGRNIPIEIEAAWDSPLHAGVLTEISLMKPDLVVKDTAWHAPLRRALFSHSDWRLLQACPVPLLLTKARPWSESARVVAAIDPGHPGDPAGHLDRSVLAAAKHLAGPIGAVLAAVHAYMPIDAASLSAAAAGMPMLPPVGRMGSQMRDAAGEAVASLLAGQGYPPEAAELVEGSAVEVLPGWCEERGVDILVVGAVSRSRLVEAVLGSTAERLLDRIPSDLLAVHPQGSAAQPM
jgi:universal stress protein E